MNENSNICSDEYSLSGVSVMVVVMMNCVSLQNGPELLPRVDMLLLLTRIIGTATPRLQVRHEATPSFCCYCFGYQRPCCVFPGAGLAVPHLSVLQRWGRSRLHGGGAGGD